MNLPAAPSHPASSNKKSNDSPRFHAQTTVKKAINVQHAGVVQIIPVSGSMKSPGFYIPVGTPTGWNILFLNLMTWLPELKGIRLADQDSVVIQYQAENKWKPMAGDEQLNSLLERFNIEGWDLYVRCAPESEFQSGSDLSEGSEKVSIPKSHKPSAQGNRELVSTNTDTMKGKKRDAPAMGNTHKRIKDNQEGSKKWKDKARSRYSSPDQRGGLEVDPDRKMENQKPESQELPELLDGMDFNERDLLDPLENHLEHENSPSHHESSEDEENLQGEHPGGRARESSNGRGSESDSEEEPEAQLRPENEYAEGSAHEMELEAMSENEKRHDNGQAEAEESGSESEDRLVGVQGRQADMWNDSGQGTDSPLNKKIISKPANILSPRVLRSAGSAPVNTKGAGAAMPPSMFYNVSKEYKSPASR